MDPIAFDFPTPDRQAWLERIKKELKGKSPEELRIQLDADVWFDPLVHPADVPQALNIPFPSDWKPGESFRAAGGGDGGNERLLRALENGTQAIALQLDSPNQLKNLLSGVYPEMVDWMLLPAGSSPAFSKDETLEMLQVFRERTQKPSALNLWIQGSPDGISPELRNEMPGVSTRILDLAADTDPDHSPVGSLARCLQALDASYSTPVFGIPLLRVKTGTNLYRNMAFLRALRLCSANILRDRASGSNPIHIWTETPPMRQDSSLQENMIGATVQTLGAILGGADLVFLPGNLKEEEPDIRLLRNIHHLLVQETGLLADRQVQDGAYYLDALTIVLAQGAWKLAFPG